MESGVAVGVYGALINRAIRIVSIGDVPIGVYGFNKMIGVVRGNGANLSIGLGCSKILSFGIVSIGTCITGGGASVVFWLSLGFSCFFG